MQLRLSPGCPDEEEKRPYWGSGSVVGFKLFRDIYNSKTQKSRTINENKNYLK